MNYADSVAGQPHPLDPDGLLGLPLTNSSDTLHMFRAKASYVYNAKYGGNARVLRRAREHQFRAADLRVRPGEPRDPARRLGVGDRQRLRQSRARRGWTLGLFWMPVQYARVGVEYTMFNKFNGQSSNYDGFGRNASDNNTLFLYVWGAY